MAISKDKKQALVAEMSELFAGAKAIAVAKYQGTSVAEKLCSFKRSQNSAVRLHCHTIALYTGFPVFLSHTFRVP